MSQDANAKVLRECYDAFARGDFEHIRAHVLADDVVFHISGRSVVSGVYKGKDEVFGLFHSLDILTNGTYRVEPCKVTYSDDCLISVSHERGERNGKVLDGQTVHVSYFADGKITEGWAYSYDQYAYDEFWS